MTLQALSQEAGLTLDGLQKIEAGRRTPNATTLAMIAQALGVSVGELLDEREPKPPTTLRTLTRLVRDRPARVQRAAVKVVRALIEAVESD